MARLPQIGGDSGTWGDVLNDFLSQVHANDGALKSGVVGAAQLKQNAVTSSAIADGHVVASKLADGAVGSSQIADDAVSTQKLADDSVEEVKLASAVRAKLNAAHSEIADGSVSTAQLADGAVSTAKIQAGAVSPDKIGNLGQAHGVASLDGSGHLPDGQLPPRLSDASLGATYATAAQGVKADAALPSSQKGAASGVATLDLTTKVPVAQLPMQAIADSSELSATFATAAQGTKADTAVQPAGLTKSAVGLGNVDNTSDASKPVSTAQATAIGLKANIGEVLPGAVPSGITGSHTNGYNSRLNVYNLKPTHFRRTRARLAAVKAQAGHFKIGVVAHSMGAGVGGTVGTDGFPETLVSVLDAAGYRSAGTGLVPCYRGGTAIDNHWTYSAGWSSFGGSSSLYWNSTTTNALVYASTVTGTAVNVYLGQTASSGAVNVSIDGGAAVLVTPNTGANTVFVYGVSGLSDTTHTVSITRNNASVFVFGVEVLKAGYGVRLYNGGIGGQQSSGIADTSWYATSPFSGSGGRWAADLNILGPIMANDGFNSVPVSTWKINMQTAINQLVADKLIVVDTPVNTLNFDAYRTAAYELADTNDIPLLDMSDRWGTYAQSNTYSMMSDGTHPNATGYAEWARALFNAIGI